MKVENNQAGKKAGIYLSILLPVRNEGINLEIMLKLLKIFVKVPHEVLIVHDTADDDSLDVVNRLASSHENLHAVYNTLGRGIPNAIRSGVAAASGEVILIFAADEVGPVFAINDMLDLMTEGCEFVSCTRYKYGGKRLGGSLLGGTFSRLANFLFQYASGCVLTDATTGIKMFRRDLYNQMKLEARPVGWAVALEMSIKAQMLGCRLGEVPIVSIDRIFGGTSTFKFGPWFVEYLRWFIWGVRNLPWRGRATVRKTVQRRSALLELRADEHP